MIQKWSPAFRGRPRNSLTNRICSGPSPERDADSRSHLPRRNCYGFVVLALLLLSGCSQRIGGGEMAIQTADAPLVIDLPALTIDYDRNGIAYVGSVPVAELSAVVGTDLTPLNLNTEQIAWLTEADLHSIQLTSRPHQLLLMVNGQPLPRLMWDEASLQAGTQLLQTVTARAEFPADIAALLPVMSSLGGGVTLQFPTAAEPVAAPLLEAPNATATAAQAAYLDLIGTPPQIAIDVSYQPDGRWLVDGLDAAAWGALLPLPWEQLNLEPETMRILQEMSIQELVVRSSQTGIFVTVNGALLPHLDWSQGELGNVVALAASSGLFTQFLGETPTADSLATTLERLVPMLQVTEVTLRVQFTDSTAD